MVPPKKDPKAAKAPVGKKGAPKKDPKGKPTKGGKKKDISSEEEASEAVNSSNNFLMKPFIP